MHSRVFQITKQELPDDDFLTYVDMPDWFYDSIADAGDDIAPENRADEINWLCEVIGSQAKADGNRLTFTEGVKKDYFEKRFITFRQKLTALQTCSLEEFAGLCDHETLDSLVYQLNDAFSDKFGFYVYDTLECELITLQEWLRNVDTAETYYVGGIINYHW